jgi:hypothetical protein
VVELDACADPARGAEWLIGARKRAASEADFQREICRNWSIVSGAIYYPEFSALGRDKYLFEPTELLASPVIRGWDFGWRAPACVWLQYSPTADRVYVLREFTPRGISAHHFRDVARYLSGQYPYEDLDSIGREWVATYSDWPGVPKPPWFAPGTQFVDLSGPEVNAVQSIASKDPEEACVRDVWAAGGIEMAIQAGRVKARALVLRRLLFPRLDGWPGIVISPACMDVLAMLEGLAYRKPTRLNPLSDEPHKDGRHDNVHDALTYALVGSVPAEGQPGVTMPARIDEMADLGWTL